MGINRLSQDSRQVVGYYDFTDDYYLHSNSKGNTWVVSHGGIFYYNTSYKRFVQIKNLKVPVEDMDKRAFVTDDGSFVDFHSTNRELLQVSQDALIVTHYQFIQLFHLLIFMRNLLKMSFIRMAFFVLSIVSMIFMFMIFPDNLKFIFVTFLH